jgi:hypothetical protein
LAIGIWRIKSILKITHRLCILKQDIQIITSYTISNKYNMRWIPHFSATDTLPRCLWPGWGPLERGVVWGDRPVLWTRPSRKVWSEWTPSPRCIRFGRDRWRANVWHSCRVPSLSTTRAVL